MAKRKAVVAMSGGVDSSVAAALLVEQAYDVTGIMLKLWRGDEINNSSGCCSVGAADDARRVADVLDIPFYVLNLAERFEESVIADFNRTYLEGRTPNPCVRCNQWIKFDTLLEKAAGLGADVLATGHYARVVEQDGVPRLLRGRDPNKDQSYVLWMLTQAQLERCTFPVGHLEKPQTRKIAEELGLRTAHKPDSQEICFVRNGDLSTYIGEKLPDASEKGPILDREGRELGRHDGLARYTVGQRKGLGLSLGVPLYVTSLDSTSNSVVVGRREDLAVTALTTEETSFVGSPPVPGTEVLVQYRAHGDTFLAVLESVIEGRAEIRFEELPDGVAPGQSAAFYSAATPDELVGGGIIESTTPAPQEATKGTKAARR